MLGAPAGGTAPTVAGDENAGHGPSIPLVDPLRRWCRITLTAPDGRPVARGALEGTGRPDLAVVEVLAALGLVAGRRRWRVVLSAVSPAVRELVALAALPVEMEGEAEGGEQALGVGEGQEEAHAGDPTA